MWGCPTPLLHLYVNDLSLSFALLNLIYAFPFAILGQHSCNLNCCVPEHQFEENIPIKFLLCLIICPRMDSQILNFLRKERYSFWAFLNQVSFKNGVLAATGLKFGASGVNFGGVWVRFWSFGMLQNRFWKALDLLMVCFLKDLWVPHLGSPVDNCGDAISAISVHSIPFCSIPLHCVPL